MKKYYDYMREISDSELFESLLGYGMFSEKLPPLFSSKKFYDYCVRMTDEFEDRWYDYIKFDSTRNSNVPRQLGIPHPFAYARLCRKLSSYWTSQLVPYFLSKTTGDTYKRSSIHLRKMAGTKSLFRMNYTNWHLDASPENDLMIGSRFLVKTDISTCFPSIYSHALPWALTDKRTAKSAPKTNDWFNQIDSATSSCKYGETHGLLIGPHSSNLLSEIVLTAVDAELSKYKYVRFIDDYRMYAANEDEANSFILDLATALGKYDLFLNHKKTAIITLPVTKEEDWVRHLNSFNLDTSFGKVSFPLVKSYLDLAVELTTKNENASAMLYALKVLAGKTLTQNGQDLCVKEAMHFAFIYPYLIPYLKDYVFDKYGYDKGTLSNFVNGLYTDSIGKANCEGAYFSLYYAIEFGIDLGDLKASAVLSSNNPILKLALYLYCKQKGFGSLAQTIKDHAKKLNDNGFFDENWLFIYEILPVTELEGRFKNLKISKVSFIEQKYHLMCHL